MENNDYLKRKLRVCVVEDEAMISEIYKRKLEDENYHVFTAEDGVKGYEVIKRSQPDIALVDVMMPNKDGINLIKQLRKDPEFSKLPVIILTNNDDPKTVEKTYDLDVAFYLIKSQYQPSDVTRIVKEVLDSKHITV